MNPLTQFKKIVFSLRKGDRSATAVTPKAFASLLLWGAQAASLLV